MKGKVFLLLAGFSFVSSQANILNYRKSKLKEEPSNSLAILESKEVTAPTLPMQYLTESIPKPNTPPVPEKEKIIVPLNPSTDPLKPQIKQSSQFTRPFNQKLIAKVNYSPDPENPHKGVVFSPLEIGSVLASMEGRIVAIDFMDGYHNYVIIEHPNGYFSVYGNLDEVFVAEGQIIKKGEILGNLMKEKGVACVFGFCYSIILLKKIFDSPEI